MSPDVPSIQLQQIPTDKQSCFIQPSSGSRIWINLKQNVDIILYNFLHKDFSIFPYKTFILKRAIDMVVLNAYLDGFLFLKLAIRYWSPQKIVLEILLVHEIPKSGNHY